MPVGDDLWNNHDIPSLAFDLVLDAIPLVGRGFGGDVRMGFARGGPRGLRFDE